MSRKRTGIVPGFHQRLNDLILQRGYNYSEVARMLEIDRKIVYGYKNGDVAPNIVILMKLCAILHTTPNWLLLGKE